MATVELRDLPMADGTCDAYVVRPDEDGDHPPVLLLMDAVGLRPRIREMCEQLADEGYVVLAPNVYYRAGRQPLVDPAIIAEGREEERKEIMFRLIRGFSEDDWAKDGPVYLDHLLGLPGVADEDVRVVGYCMGGRLGLLLAAQRPDDVSVVCGYHVGGLVTDDPRSPHRRLDEVDARLYFGFADQDASMTAEQVETLRLAAEDAGCDYEGEIYAGAAHGYTMADLPSYDEAATARHWETLVQVFDEA